MVLESRQSLLAAFGLAIIASLSVGYLGAGLTESPTGAFAGDSSSKEDIRSTVQGIMDQQMQQQQQQLALVAQQSENLSADDLSLEANVESIEESEFESLYKVTVSTTGETPSQQNPGETESIDEEQVLYISKNGRYLFRQPTDLENMESQTEQPQPQQPPTDEE